MSSIVKFNLKYMIDETSIIITDTDKIHRLMCAWLPRSAIEGSLARCAYPHVARNRWRPTDLNLVMWRSVEAELCPVRMRRHCPVPSFVASGSTSCKVNIVMIPYKFINTNKLFRE